MYKKFLPKPKSLLKLLKYLPITYNIINYITTNCILTTSNGNYKYYNCCLYSIYWIKIYKYLQKS